ncbi:DUF4440 domain-containing protein [Clostridium felsineum]|uniref:nuclear transport factor 2 family protein n=1 Tax=Clostridium felsineum TaxID=36839 RepID=UPI00098CB852|nr:DUF4440 domain-containing protein [Clostridium felsineum]
MNAISKKIFELESSLLKSSVRKSADKVSEILSEDYIEFCSSGKEYHYEEGDVFQDPNDTSDVDYEVLDFRIKKLEENCILALYKVIKHNEGEKYSLRSSIWKCVNGQFKLIFHQGTNIPKI